MIRLIRFHSAFLSSAFALTVLTGCIAAGPTLHESRRGQGQISSDSALEPGEIRAEVMQVHPNRNEIQVRSEDNRTRTLRYDTNRTLVIYNGREYTAENLEAGDVIAFQTEPRGGIVDTIRVQEPVQARASSTAGRRLPPSRHEVVDGTVERIDYDRGIFDVRTRDRGTITVTLPYNASTSDVDDFRRLRQGDSVRLEGDFVNRNNFQVSSISR